MDECVFCHEKIHFIADYVGGVSVQSCGHRWHDECEKDKFGWTGRFTDEHYWPEYDQLDFVRCPTKMCRKEIDDRETLAVSVMALVTLLMVAHLRQLPYFVDILLPLLLLTAVASFGYSYYWRINMRLQAENKRLVLARGFVLFFSLAVLCIESLYLIGILLRYLGTVM